MVTIVLADDHPIVRRGLRASLEAERGFSIIGEAGNGLEAAELVERLQPDVLVLDLMMPGLNGLEVTRQVRRRSPATRVVILSMYANEAYVLESLRAGVCAYVVKESSSDELVRAIHETAAGRRYLSSCLSERAIQAYVEKAEGAAPDPYDTLTVREQQVLHLAAEGWKTNHIAARLFISPRTVDTHRTSLKKKLGLHSQTDIVRYAMKKGILPIEDRSL